ncbi:MAG: hypothetical protein GQ532_17545 [Methylomarinum sp.]|nr:hypothetical protein [Methylomarinum sp.]
MNNVTPINKAPRLTEKEVHEAAQNLIDSNESVSSLSLLKVLGRGSLTTITKYMSSFNKDKEEPENNVLSPFTEIPESLSRSTKLLAIKIWTESQEIANKELESQREVLQQAAKLSADRVKEAEVFSDEQAKRLEEIERTYGQEIEDLSNNLNTVNTELSEKNSTLNNTVIELEVSKNEITLLKDALQDTKNQLNELKENRQSDLTELRHDNQSKIEDLKTEIKDKQDELLALKTYLGDEKTKLDAENNRLDLQVAKQQMSLDLISKRLEEEKYLRSADVKENKVLREKSALLEGELTAWKKIHLKESTDVKKKSL